MSPPAEAEADGELPGLARADAEAEPVALVLVAGGRADGAAALATGEPGKPIAGPNGKGKRLQHTTHVNTTLDFLGLHWTHRTG